MDGGAGGPAFDAFVALDRALDAALAHWKRTDDRFTLLFSGGVDSGLIAWELRHNRGMSAVTVGRPGSPDLVETESAARELGLRWSPHAVTDADLERLERRFAQQFAGLPEVAHAILLSLAAAFESAPDSTVLCGQGIDELFLGYAHFRNLPPAAAARRAREDLSKLTAVDWPKTQAIAEGFDRTVVAPYLDPGFVTAALAIPIDDRLPDGEPKQWFRRWARHRGLPDVLARRPKRAFQYGTRIQHWIAKR